MIEFEQASVIQNRLRALPERLECRISSPSGDHPLTVATREVVTDLIALAGHDKLWMSEVPGEGPSITLHPPGQGPFGVSWWGPPTGYELLTLIDAMESAVSLDTPGQTPVDQVLAALPPLLGELYVAPT